MRPDELAAKIEHSLLSPTARGDDVRTICSEALENGFYSVCVNPSRVSLARVELAGTGVRLTTVVGFPLGAATSQSKVREALNAINLGADEVDMVMSIGAALEGDWAMVEREISDVCRAIKGPTSVPLLKVIIECCYLNEQQKRKAIEAVVSAGADYVKTSTGFGPSGAMVEDVALMREVLRGRARIKAAGGIKTLDDMRAMVDAGADLIGTSSGVSIIKESFGP